MTPVRATSPRAAGAWRPLTSVRIVLSARPSVAALLHVVASVDGFLDASQSLSVGSASRLASVRLLERVALRSAAGSSLQSRKREFETAMEAVAEHGNLDVARWLVQSYCPEGRVGTETVATLAANGHLGVLAWLFDTHDNVYWGGEEMHMAVEFNRLDVAKWLQDHTLPPPEDLLLLDEAARHGDLEMMEWLHNERGEQVSYDGIMRAVNNGFLPAVQWLCATFNYFDPRDLCMDKAAGKGHLEMVKWLHSQEAWCTNQAMNRAARNGHLEVVVWLHNNRSEGCSSDAMDYAASNGHFDVVKWLSENRSEGCTEFAIDNAAKNGHKYVVQWLYQHRPEGFTAAAIQGAGQNSYWDIAEWLNRRR